MPATAVDSEVGAKKWHRTAFVITTGLVALWFMTNLGNALAPWFPDASPALADLTDPEIHLWHVAVPGAVSGILTCGVLLALLRNPQQKPLLVQWMGLSLVVTLPIIVPFAGVSVILFAGIPLLLVVAVYPWRSALLDFSWGEGMNRPLLALTVAATALLVPSLWTEFGWQLDAVGGEHATASHWASDLEHLALLLLAGFFASTRRPGWRPLAILTGIAFIYLGAVAVGFPDQAGSWGVTGGVLAFAGGAGFIGATLQESRSRMKDSAPATQTTA